MNILCLFISYNVSPRKGGPDLNHSFSSFIFPPALYSTMVDINFVRDPRPAPTLSTFHCPPPPPPPSELTSFVIGPLRKQPRKCEAFKIFTKGIPINTKNQFLWSKNSISMPFVTGVRGGRGTSKFVLTPANFPPTLITCEFASFYRSFAL